MTDRYVEAAGGLVLRRSDDRVVRMLLVHRPRYDDWSLPKGKADAGETPEATALREIVEETGVTGRVVAPLDTVEYGIGAGRRKVVRYFAVRAQSESPFVGNDEVDSIRWVTQDEAARLLTYDHDRQLAASDLEALATTGTMWLIRHAAAGSRETWDGDDRLRPLSTKGIRQAEALADDLAGHDIDAIHSSPYTRCRQTMEPLALQTRLPVRDAPLLAEGASGSSTLEWLLSMAGDHVVACSHGDVIPEILRLLERRGVEFRGPAVDVKKASSWVLDIRAGVVASAHYVPPPAV